MRRTICILTVSLLMGSALMAVADDSEITITIVGKKPELEEKAKTGLEELLKKYDLSRYLFTKKIQVEDGVIPHSHPVLTINTSYIGKPNKLLTTFIHEQLHWWLADKDDAVNAAVAEFKKRYPTLPTDRRDLARDEYSTYMHLIVCYLELVSLREVAGNEVATEVFDWLKGHHYRWIYRTVLQDEAEVGAIVRKHGLMLPDK